jgi:hypothetical protein
MTVTPQQIERFRSLGFSISLPYNSDVAMWEQTRHYRSVIGEVYAGLHPDVFPSGRRWGGGLDPDAYLARLVEVARQIHADGVPLNVVLNAIPHESLVDGDRLARHLETLMAVCDMTVAVSDPHWGRWLRKRFPQVALQVSGLAEIETQYQAAIWIEALQPKTINIGRELNKRPTRIKQIRSLGVRIKMIVADGCTPLCANRRYVNQVHVHTGAASDPEDDVPACIDLRARLPDWQLLKKEVLPFMLPEYSGVVDLVKVVDRNHPTQQNIEYLETYLRMESDIHPYRRYREFPGTLAMLDTCAWDCVTCQYCRTHCESPLLRPDRTASRQH